MSARDLAAGKARHASHRIAKHLGAYVEGLRLLAYDPARLTLQVPIGAQLFGLYERAAVLCSGRMPSLSGGRVEYSDVPADVAAALGALFKPDDDLMGA